MKTSKIIIIDYGSGNLHSVANALEVVKNPDQEIIISNNHLDLKSANHIILPGVGAFNDCISSLKAIPNMINELKEQVLTEKKPFLGICVGMQLLADKGYENGEHEGLGFIAGDVVKLENFNNSLKIPHMGWNNLSLKKPNHTILEGIKDAEHAYFANSYHFVCKNKEDVIATFNYGNENVAIIAKDNIFATQFHPEKSADIGLRLLKNFITKR